MKKIFVIFILLFSIILIGCNNTTDPIIEDPIIEPEPTEPTIILPNQIIVDIEKDEIYVGEELPFNINILPDDANDKSYDISISDENIIKIIDNKIVGIAKGDAEIKITSKANDILEYIIFIKVKEELKLLYRHVIYGFCGVYKQYDLYEGEEPLENDFEQIDDFEVVRVETEYKESGGIMYRYDKPIYQPIIKPIDLVASKLDEFFLDRYVDSDVTFPSSIDNATIIYSSSNPARLNKDGKYTINYQEVMVTITATITLGNDRLTKDYEVAVKGYKELKNICAGYLYRNYNLVNDNFFEINDIVYCCFMQFNSDGTIASSINDKITRYIIPKCKEKGIYVLASFNGPDTFSIVAGSEELRKKAARNLVNLINDLNLDGIDFDWETPKSSEAKNFTALCKEAYTQIKANNPNHLLTAAIGGGKWQIEKCDMANSIKYLDYVNIMTYSMVSNSGIYQTALFRNTTAYDKVNNCGKTMDSCSIDETAEIYRNHGVPNSKMIWGMAFYGVKQTKTDGAWKNGKSVLYSTMIKDYLNNPYYKYYYDERCEEPYLLSTDGLYFISYDDPRSIIAKCKYSMENNMAGVMYWEWGCDYLTDELLLAIKEGFNK